MTAPKRKIAVVGAGSAGLLTAAHLCTWLDNTWEVWAIHDPTKQILGIGESTNGAFMSVLERGTNFSIAHAEDLAALDATIKYGSKFSNWRQQQWVNPLLSGNIAIHFDNRRFKDFVFERLSQIWPEQFRVQEADVMHVENYGDYVSLQTDQGALKFDYVVDCRGTPEDFTGYTMSDCTLVDRCLVHTVQDYEYEPFTDHIATRGGWMFGVPLRGRKCYGYLYNHELTALHEAEAEMKTMMGAAQLQAGNYDAQYAFRCYYANELISGRVCKNGNRALFFEPLLANSMFLYIYAARLIFDNIASGLTAARSNTLFTKAVHEMEDVISYYYKGGSTFDSPFWQQSAEHARARLERRTELSEYFLKLRGLKERGLIHRGTPYAFSPSTWQNVDTHMGYGSFESA